MLKNAGLMRRFAASIYELLSLIAIWLLTTFVFVMFFGSAETALERFALQVVLWLVTGVYLMACWVKTGQTLATQAWKIKLVNADGQLLSIKQAFMRYVLASISLLVLGLGFLWALVDKDRLFLHDRLSKTRLTLLKTD